jgi:hypothetical protein
MLLTRGHYFGLKFCWINQLTRIFYHNERAVLCWLIQLSGLNFGPKQGPLFSPSQYRLYSVHSWHGQERGQVYFIDYYYFIIYYYFTLFKSTFADWWVGFSFVQHVLSVGLLEKAGWALGSVGGHLPPPFHMTYPLLIFHQLENGFTVYIVVVHHSVYHTQSTQYHELEVKTRI